MKKLSLLCLVFLVCSYDAFCQPISSNVDESKVIDEKKDNMEDQNLKAELRDFQKIQREGEYLKLRIANRNLMHELGINERSDIFDDDIRVNNKNTEVQKKTFLVSTFKIGKGKEEAKVFVLGRGMMTVKNGDYIMDDVKILSINHGSAEAIVIPTGYTFELPQINIF